MPVTGTGRSESRPEAAAALTVLPEQVNGTLRVTVSGELDLLTEPYLVETLRQLVGECDAGRVVLDVGGVSFIDSSGLRALLVSRDETTRAGRSICLAVGSGPVPGLLELAGVSGWFSYE